MAACVKNPDMMNCFELLSRRFQMWESAYAKQLRDAEAGSGGSTWLEERDILLGVERLSGSSIVMPELEEHVATLFSRLTGDLDEWATLTSQFAVTVHCELEASSEAGSGGQRPRCAGCGRKAGRARRRRARKRRHRLVTAPSNQATTIAGTTTEAPSEADDMRRRDYCGRAGDGRERAGAARQLRRVPLRKARFSIVLRGDGNGQQRADQDGEELGVHRCVRFG